MNYLAIIEKLPIEVIQDFNKSGKSKAIPENVQKYINEINDASRIKKFEFNISRAANKLMLEHPHLAFHTARQRIYDAINFFSLNNTVKNEAWDQVYADRLDDYSTMAIAMNDIPEARRNSIAAHRLRTSKTESAFDGHFIGPRLQVVSCEVTHERLGITKENKKMLASKGWSFINDISISKKDREKISQDIMECLGIEDTEFEELKNE